MEVIMPKQKITKEMVVHAAFELARTGGMEQVMVKNIAQKLNCSVQPIYSYCNNMDGLRNDVVKQARAFIQEYITAHIDEKDLFRSTGKAYIQIAKDEPHIFKLFIFQERKNISSLEELYQSETNTQVAQKIAEELKINIEQAKKLHLNMLIYTIGIGTIFSVTTPGISADEIYLQQEQAYEVFLKAALQENG